MDELLDNFDDEEIEDEFDDGYSILTEEEMLDWLEGIPV